MEDARERLTKEIEEKLKEATTEQLLLIVRFCGNIVRQ